MRNIILFLGVFLSVGAQGASVVTFGHDSAGRKVVTNVDNGTHRQSNSKGEAFKNKVDNTMPAKEKQEICQVAKRLLNSYVNDGVKTVNRNTGRIENASESESKALIEAQRHKVSIFCH